MQTLKTFPILDPRKESPKFLQPARMILRSVVESKVPPCTSTEKLSISGSLSAGGSSASPCAKVRTSVASKHSTGPSFLSSKVTSWDSSPRCHSLSIFNKVVRNHNIVTAGMSEVSWYSIVVDFIARRFSFTLFQPGCKFCKAGRRIKALTLPSLDSSGFSLCCSFFIPTTQILPLPTKEFPRSSTGIPRSPFTNHWRPSSLLMPQPSRSKWPRQINGVVTGDRIKFSLKVILPNWTLASLVPVTGIWLPCASTYLLVFTYPGDAAWLNRRGNALTSAPLSKTISSSSLYS